MKHICFVACLLATIPVAAQKITAFYDYQWKRCEAAKARFYSEMEKTDSGWLRSDYYMGGSQTIQMRALFQDSACKIHNGNVKFYYPNGHLSSAGRMINNKNEGICLSFYSNGMLSDSALYHNGRPVGYKFRWHANGYMSDSTAHVNDSMDVYVSWFDNGSPSAAGYYLRGKFHGKWQFFHKSGKPAAKESYDHGKLTAAEFFNEDGSLLEDTAKATVKATFKGGLEGWGKYLERNLYWPTGLKFDNGGMAVVALDITIDETGKVELVEVAIPFHPEFDKIALKVLRNSPNWQPAVSHNRKIKSTFRQPVVFRQPES